MVNSENKCSVSKTKTNTSWHGHDTEYLRTTSNMNCEISNFDFPHYFQAIINSDLQDGLCISLKINIVVFLKEWKLYRLTGVNKNVYSVTLVYTTFKTLATHYYIQIRSYTPAKSFYSPTSISFSRAEHKSCKGVLTRHNIGTKLFWFNSQ